MTEGETSSLGLIAGNGIYPQLVARAARARGVSRIAAVCFKGETDPALEALVDEYVWLRVGQLSKMLRYFQDQKISRAMMVGQIAPSNLFNLRPDLKALLLLAQLKERNAETIFGGLCGEMAKVGVTVLPATTYLEEDLAPEGLIAGPAPSRKQLMDIELGYKIAKEVSRMDVGQTVVVKNGTILAVEAFEGTDAALRRGGSLGKGGAVAVKVTKPNQDMRFDVPVVGLRTLDSAGESDICIIAVEAGKTLLLEKEAVCKQAQLRRITLYGVKG